MTIYGPLSTALVRPLPRSFLNALKKYAPSVPIDWKFAHEQHEAYTEVVRQLVPSVMVVPADEAFPDCCFIEDTAVVSGRDVVISRIGAESRRGESEAIAEVFQKLGSTVHRLHAPATLDGGDVLQMKEHIFIGLSERTNQAAVDQMIQLLPDRKITPVSVQDGLHLKSVLSALADDVLLAADNAAGRAMAAEILDALGGDARCVFVPDSIAANVVRLGSTVLIQAGFPASEAILREVAQELNLSLMTLPMSELIKADGALTCCSLLVPAL